MKTIIQPVKGTRDFYPEDMALRSWFYRTLQAVSESFGYQEWEGPILERIDLYAAKSGEELVKEQAFVFPDRGGDQITLRPELTPTLARIVAQRQRELVYPLRLFSFGPFWRYERPQKGRTREFFQWNIDLIGVNAAEADAELLAVCATFFTKVGLTPDQVSIAVNDRRLMDDQLAQLGVDGALRKGVFQLIDRRDKMSPADWDAFAVEKGLNEAQLSGLKGLLADKELWKKSESLSRVFALMEAMGFRDYLTYDAQIIRGLDYYTGIVFEARDLDGGRAILGGGHYDNLVGDVGGDPLPGVGFAMGDVMAGIVMQKYGCVPQFRTSTADVLVTIFDPERAVGAFELAAELRRDGLKAMAYPEVVKFQKQLKFADRIGVRFVVIIGPDEAAAGVATIKNLVQRTQVTVKREDVSKTIREMLALDAAV